jgi:hypothetical protein
MARTRCGLTALAGGPDVREVARAVKSARSTEPEPADDRLPGLITDNRGTPLRLIRTAVRYWAIEIASCLSVAALPVWTMNFGGPFPAG